MRLLLDALDCGLLLLDSQGRVEQVNRWMQDRCASAPRLGAPLADAFGAAVETRLLAAVHGQDTVWDGVDLEIRPSALKAIARKALARKTGARGLRSIVELALIDTMFDLPNSSNVERVVVDESTIDENKPPLLVYREAAKKA